MDWYYEEDGSQVGPIDNEKFEELITSGVITDNTLVWNSGFSEWLPYSKVMKQDDHSNVASDSTMMRQCSECGRSFPENDLIRFGDDWICLDCKTVYLQKIREGVAVSQSMDYGGFWIRFVAKFVDGLILWVLSMILNFAILPFLGLNMSTMQNGKDLSPAFWAIYILVQMINMSIQFAYATWFIGKFAATPGKMLFRLKVVTPEGGKVTYWRALGRTLAEMLSTILFFIGYLMAAFDDEKRTLHDRLASTRVIRA